MPPWLGHDFRVRHTTLDQESPERIGLKDLAPWFDRPIEFRILLADCFPEYAVGRFEQASTPNGDRQQPIRADKTPQLPDRSFYVRDEKDPKNTEYSVKCSIRKRQAFKVSTTKLNICETFFRGALGSFIQEIAGEIDSDNVPSWTDAFGRWNGRCTHAATNIKDSHAGNKRETIDSPSTVAIPE